MKVGFFTVFRKDPIHYVLAELLVRSVRASMPGVEIAQFTDETSPSVFDVDEVIRKPHGKMLERRLEHYASVEGDWLFVDTDVIVQRDVRAVFASAFDVALSDRNWPHIPSTPALTEAMPFNTGVVFSRSAAFWRAALDTWRALPPEKQADWMSEQLAVADVVRRGQHLVMVLPGGEFNYPPATPGDPGVAQAAIVHYKGPRKAWMRSRPQTVAAAVPQPIQARPVAAGPLRVFIGYDPRQPIAYHVTAHSVASRASVPVAITPLRLAQLPITRRGLTEFTYSRFLVPHLSGHTGWSVFLDADMLCLGDLAELVAIAQAQPPAAVHVIKHKQRFEWASLMVFDNARCSTLTPAYVQDASHGLFDLKFADAIGALPAEWNHLVGYDALDPNAKLVHFTQGIPVWPETQACEYAGAWQREREALLHTVSFAELMGSSVHVQHMAKG